MARQLNISSWFNQDAFSDVTLKFSGREIKCHKVVLSDSSEYFKKLLNPKGGFAESKQATIELKDDSPDAVEAMIRYIYSFDYGTGDADITDLQLGPTHHIDVYKVAHKYLLPTLQEKAMARLSTVLSGRGLGDNTFREPEDIFDLIMLLAEHRQYDERFEREMMDLMLKNLSGLIRLGEFREWIDTEDDVLKAFFEVVDKGVTA